MTKTIPTDLLDLLTEPHFASLGSIRPDGAVQVNPMWFEFDGETIRFTHTTQRVKFRNLQLNPAMTVLVLDPADPMRFLEVRGRLIDVIADPEGDFYVHLGQRYGNPHTPAPADKADRVILVMSIEKTTRK
ncbi:PPOX class F420-dependent oxidoreductase [Leifsonia kafniensis]|uniref:PPOX class F420-dependent oxidoreductase n=1 Tax=Leifsonia kafniensis TaxID=475957 RepID=A0ABP7LA49_9MICO